MIRTLIVRNEYMYANHRWKMNRALPIYIYFVRNKLNLDSNGQKKIRWQCSYHWVSFLWHIHLGFIISDWWYSYLVWIWDLDGRSTLNNLLLYWAQHLLIILKVVAESGRCGTMFKSFFFLQILQFVTNFKFLMTRFPFRCKI